MKQLSLGFVALCFLVVQPPKARADQITTYNVSGTFMDSSTLSGTLTADNTSGSVESMSITLATPDGTWLFTNPQQASNGNTELFASTLTGVDEDVILAMYPATNPTSNFFASPGVIPLATNSSSSLIPWTGYQFDSGYDYPFPPVIFQGFVGSALVEGANLVQGELTPTPEPASVVLLASGVFVAGRFGLYRRRGRS
jgi:hypothetical protein